MCLMNTLLISIEVLIFKPAISNPLLKPPARKKGQEPYIFD